MREIDKTATKTEKPLPPSRQRKLLVGLFKHRGAASFAKHVGVDPGSDPMEALMGHYLRPDGRYDLLKAGNDLASYQPVIDAFDKAARRKA